MPTRMDLIAMDFPKRLASLRNERGMTQGTLAEHVGIHVSQLRRYEAGAPRPPSTCCASSRSLYPSAQIRSFSMPSETRMRSCVCS